MPKNGAMSAASFGFIFERRGDAWFVRHAMQKVFEGGEHGPFASSEVAAAHAMTWLSVIVGRGGVTVGEVMAGQT
jgi:hypothetical protein